MELIPKAKSFLKLLCLKSKHNHVIYILFKIIDINHHNIYTLQCVNTKSIFQANILEIISDLDILHGLHPIQACFIGIEYAKYSKTNHISKQFYCENSKKINSNWRIQYQNRVGDICYIEIHSNKEFIMCPKKIAASEKIIEKFHAAQAFYIGICAGLKIHKRINNIYPITEINTME